MNEWLHTCLGEVLRPGGYIRGPFGSSLRRSELVLEGTPVYEQQHAIYGLREFRFYIDDEKLQELRRFLVEPGDIIISCSGTVGRVSMISETDPVGIISQALLTLRAKAELLRPIYLYYFLKSDLGQGHLLAASHGSVQPNIAEKKIVLQIPLQLPPLKEQDIIIEVLSSLDDKIDLLHRQNKTLEQMAETLYRQWFVEEAVEDWKEGCLGDIALFYNGKSRPQQQGSVPVYGGNGILSYADRANYSGRSIIIGRVGAYCGSLYYDTGDIWVSDNALLTRPKVELHTHYLYQLLKTLDLNSLAEGSSHPLLTQGLLKSIPISIAPPEKRELFEYYVEPWSQKTQANQDQIRVLLQTRDILLPKLMSGEVRAMSTKMKPELV